MSYLDQKALMNYLLDVGDIPVPNGKELAIKLWDTVDESGLIDFLGGDFPSGFAIGGIYYWRAGQLEAEDYDSATEFNERNNQIREKGKNQFIGR